MTTVVDTNILVALWDADDVQSAAAQAALDAALDRGKLVIPAPVFSELLALPQRKEAFLDQFLRETGIVVEWRLSEAVWREAGKAFGAYALRRRRQRGISTPLNPVRQPGPRRILADFLIGVYAAHNGFPLLTLDRGIYRAIPGIKLVVA
jgi:predicted nucleic acid-binding protein